jgi:anti-sigma factor RsiW
MTEPRTDLACREVVDLVGDYLEGALDPSQARQFENHLSACDGCARYVDQMRLTIAAVGQLGGERVPPETRRRLLTAFRDWKQSAGYA